MAMSKIKGLQMWCKARTEGYCDVEIRDMSSSWKNGLAFCAIIHRHRPDLINYENLRKEDVFENNDLAFTVADRELGIPALLEAADMVAMRVPDKLCVITYVAQYHTYFKDQPQLGGPNVQAAKWKTSATKRPMQPSIAAPPAKVANVAVDGEEEKNLTRITSMGDTCVICKKKVYLLERQIEGHKLYHRTCYRDNVMSPTNKIYARPADLCMRPTPQKETKDMKSGAMNPHDCRVNNIAVMSDTDAMYHQPANLVKTELCHEKVQSKNGLKDVDENELRGVTPRSVAQNMAVSPEKKSQVMPVPKKRTSQEDSSITDSRHSQDSIFDGRRDDASKSVRLTNVQPDRQKWEQIPKVVDILSTHTDDLKQTDQVTKDISNFDSYKADENLKTITTKMPYVKKSAIKSKNIQASPRPQPRSTTQNLTVENRESVVILKPKDDNVKSGLLKSLANVRHRQPSDLDSMLEDNEKICENLKTEKKAVRKSKVKIEGGKHDDKLNFLCKKSDPVKNQHDDVGITQNHDVSQTGKKHKKVVIPPQLDVLNAKEAASKVKAEQFKNVDKFSKDDDKDDKDKKLEWQNVVLKKQNAVKNGHGDSEITHNCDVETAMNDDSKLEWQKVALRKTGHEKKTYGGTTVASTQDSWLADRVRDCSMQNPTFIPPHPKGNLHDNEVDTRKDGNVNVNVQDHKVVSPHPKVITHSNMTEGIGKTKLKDLNADRKAIPPRPKGIAKSNATDEIENTKLKEVNTDRKAIPPRPQGIANSSVTDEIENTKLKQVNTSRKAIPPRPKGITNTSITDEIGNTKLKEVNIDRKAIPPRPKGIANSNMTDEIENTKLKGVNDSDKKIIPPLSNTNLKGGNNKYLLEREKIAESIDKKIIELPDNDHNVEDQKDHRVLGQKMTNQMTDSGEVVNIPHKVTLRPLNEKTVVKELDWQLEAKKRSEARGGMYADPEKGVGAGRRKLPVIGRDVPHPPVRPPRTYEYNKPEHEEVIGGNHQAVVNDKYNKEKKSDKVAGSKSTFYDDSTFDSELDTGMNKGYDVDEKFMKTNDVGENYDIFGPDYTSYEIKIKVPERRIRPDIVINTNLTEVDEAHRPVAPHITPRVSVARKSQDHICISPAERDSSPCYVKKEMPPVSPRKVISPDNKLMSSDTDVLPVSPTRPTKRRAPGRPPPPRRSTGLNRICAEDIQKQLRQIDERLTELEHRGRDLEDAIRRAGEDDDDKLMIDWFKLVNEKNDLVRDEADIIYQAREQELEDQQVEIDFKLRQILSKPDHQKTEDDYKDEEYLLTELLKVVEQRDRIVDSIDEDKQRYEEEDKDIINMMKNKGFMAPTLSP